MMNFLVMMPSLAMCSYMRTLHQHRHRLLDEAFAGSEQLGAERAVDDAVIAGERHRHLADEAHAAVFILDPPPLPGAHRQDGRVRGIDDGRERSDAVHSEIGDAGRAALILLRLELARTGA